MQEEEWQWKAKRLTICGLASWSQCPRFPSLYITTVATPSPTSSHRTFLIHIPSITSNSSLTSTLVTNELSRYALRSILPHSLLIAQIISSCGRSGFAVQTAGKSSQYASPLFKQWISTSAASVETGRQNASDKVTPHFTYHAINIRWNISPYYPIVIYRHVPRVEIHYSFEWFIFWSAVQLILPLYHFNLDLAASKFLLRSVLFFELVSFRWRAVCRTQSSPRLYCSLSMLSHLQTNDMMFNFPIPKITYQQNIRLLRLTHYGQRFHLQ